MIRKWMLMVLALMLAVSLPLSAMADTRHTLSILPGDLLASEQAIAELLEAVDLRITAGERSGALTVLISDQELATIGLSADATGFYASSELLGEDVLYVTWDDGFALLIDSIKASLQEAGADAASIQAVEASFVDLKNSIVEAIVTGSSVPVQTTATATLEESLQLVEEMFPGDVRMVEYVRGLYEGMVVEDGDFTSENRDAADQKMVFTMDEADFAAILDTEYLRSVVKETLLAENAAATEEDVDSVIEEARTVLAQSGAVLNMEMYTLDEGETLVGLKMDMSMDVPEDPAAGIAQTDVRFYADYARQTTEEGVKYRADGGMAVDGDEIQFTVDVLESGNGASKGLAGLLVDGEEVVVLYQAENTAPDTRERKVELYLRSGAAAILEPASSDRPIFGFEIVTEPAPAEVLSALENAQPTNSTDVLKLSEEGMNALLTTIVTNASQAYYRLLELLPTSVLNMLMGSAA